jgi:hypothetical protein
MDGSRGRAGEPLGDARLDEDGEMRIGPAAGTQPASAWSRDAPISVAAACKTCACRGAGPPLIGRSSGDYWLQRDGFTPWAESQSASGLTRSG